MLNKLIINNVALISDLELDFGNGLNVLSGETGAGKSIIVDSLMLLLGGRYDKTLLKYGESEGRVEGFFADVPPSLLDEIGLDADDCVIIKRKFFLDGKNEIKVNGQTVTLSMLKKFAQKIVDIYGQNDYQSLANPSRHLDILDYYVRHTMEDLFVSLESMTREYGDTARRFESIGDSEQRERNIGILSYQIEEIKKAAVKESEEDDLLERRKILLAAERIRQNLKEAESFIDGAEDKAGGYTLLLSAQKSLGQIAALSSVYDDIYSRLSDVSAEIGDLRDTISSALEQTDFDTGDLDSLEKRLEIVRNIKRKYGDFSAMSKFLEKSSKDLDFLQNATDMYDKLASDMANQRKKIYAISKEISDGRKHFAQTLTEKVMRELDELGMKDSKFEVVFSDFPPITDCEKHISKNGMDKVEFYLSANLGQPLLPLAKIISGGEMSRFMLALKVISGDIDSVQTMIFDEIDAGISGSIGRVIAQKLARISSKRQVLCVTHLPQIAAMADTHFYISKAQKNGCTVTNVEKLPLQGIISEISRLSGGQDISSQSANNAKEMKEWSNAYKKTLAQK